MAYSYDEMQGSALNVSDHPSNRELHSMPKSSPPDGTKLAGDVISLPINPGPNAGANSSAIKQTDSDKVTSYGTFLGKKFPLKDK